MGTSRQESFLSTGRQNQKLRTREALLDAAVALSRDGQSPTIAQVAEAAKVSLATAHRYFPNRQSLWADVATREASSSYPGFLADLPDDPEERIDAVVREVARFQFADEVVWRNVQRASIDRWFTQLELPEAERVPVRGSARLDMARAALAPLRDRLPPERLERLIQAVVLVFGGEAMVATRDSLGLEPDQATEVMSWAAKALIRAALAEHADADNT
ncbi:TetR/AcrR family transcriptional regulator [Nocardia sp. NPDC052566]|uniref:TetR/AcrR family transcriptional regulator n=1 Tax=Nocardia sp. NPDC052566 TaxID=3364330 RepID=UPI0037CC490B